MWYIVAILCVASVVILWCCLNVDKKPDIVEIKNPKPKRCARESKDLKMRDDYIWDKVVYSRYTYNVSEKLD